MKHIETKKMGLLGTVLGLMLLLAFILCMPSKMMAENGKTPAGDDSSVFDDSAADDSGADAEDDSEDEPDDEEEAAEDEDTEGSNNEIRMSTDGTFEFHVQDADLRDVLKHLSSLGRINIIVTKDVQGSVTLDMYGVTLMEALRIIVRSNGLVYRKEGKFIFIYTAKEYEASRKMEFRVFRLSFIRAEDAQKLIAGALSEKGKVTVTPPTKTGIVEPPSDINDQGGAMNHASNEVVIVFDYEENLEKVAEILHDVDVRPQQVLIEATILSAELQDNTSLGVDINALALNSKGYVDVKLPFKAKTLDNVDPMSVGILYNNTEIVIQALEQVTNTTVLANPKMLVVNKQRGEILVGNEDGYITTEISEGLVTQTVEFLKTGTNLIVRPFISEDGFVRIELHPEISSGAVAIVDGASEVSTPLPSKKTTTMTSNILVKDGHTIVIGGLFQDRIKTERSQVPILGDIPHIGAAFRSTFDETIREEIIIFITPHIIRHADDEAFSANIKDDAERARIGARKSLQWFGRTRMADMYINEAERAYSDGNTSWANWNLDLALAIQPEEDQAIKLKEKITGSPYWSDVPRFSRTRQIVDRMVMNELNLDDKTVVYPTKSLNDADIPKAARKRLGIRRSRKVVVQPRKDVWKKKKDDSGIEIFTPEEVKPSTVKPKTKPESTKPVTKPAPELVKVKPATVKTPEKLPAKGLTPEPKPAPKVEKAKAKPAKVAPKAEKVKPVAPKTEKIEPKSLQPDLKTKKVQPKPEPKVEKVIKLEAAPVEPKVEAPAEPEKKAAPEKTPEQRKKEFQEKVNQEIKNIESSVEEKIEKDKIELETNSSSGIESSEPDFSNASEGIRIMDPKLRQSASKDVMPRPQKILSTSPLLPEPKPVSLSSDVRKKIQSEPSTQAVNTQPARRPGAKANTTTTNKADKKSKTDKWNVWTVWDEDEPVSSAR